MKFPCDGCICLPVCIAKLSYWWDGRPFLSSLTWSCSLLDEFLSYDQFLDREEFLISKNKVKQTEMFFLSIERKKK